MVVTSLTIDNDLTERIVEQIPPFEASLFFMDVDLILLNVMFFLNKYIVLAFATTDPQNALSRIIRTRFKRLNIDIERLSSSTHSGVIISNREGNGICAQVHGCKIKSRL